MLRIKLTSIAPLLAAAAAGAVIATAPVASAADSIGAQTCTTTASVSQCQSRGNVQINASPPPVEYHPYGGLEYLLGGSH